MDFGRIRRDVSHSFEVAVTEEWRLALGAGSALLAYSFWVGITGAGIRELAKIVGISTAMDPWTGQTTGLAALLIFLWILLPAGALVYFLHKQLTNIRGNLEQYYRIGHPPALLLPPLILVAAGAGAVVGLGEARLPALLVILLGGVYLHARTITYAYRVFSLSLPRLLIASFAPTALLVVTTVLVEAATAVGRDSFVNDAATGLGEAIGSQQIPDLITGSTTVGDWTMSTLLAAAIAAPLALCGIYVAIQFLFGLLVRALAREVPRSELRTGQRYPAFAQPTTANEPSMSPTTTDSTSTATTTSTTGGTATPTTDSPSTQPSTAESTQSGTSSEGVAAAGSSDTTDTTDEGEVDDVSHTRVFTPSTDEEQTTIAGGNEAEECPFCEATVDPAASECDSCGARL
jgi:hypothetical protein